MNSGAPPFVMIAAAVAGGVLLLTDLALSAALVAVAALGRVTLHRLNTESGGRLRFAEEMTSASSSYRLATVVCRQFSLLGVCVLAGTTASLSGLPAPWVFGTATAALVGVVVVETLAAHVVALRHPRAVLRIVAPLLHLLHGPIAPLTSPLTAMAKRVREDAPDGEPHDEDDDGGAEAFIEVGEKEGILEATEGRMMRGIVDLAETRVREIMTPRTDILALPAEVPVGKAIRMLRRANHTRLPVYRGTIDDVVGILHVRDLVRAWEEGSDADPVTAYLRPAFFVPEVMSVADLLTEMRTRTHVALAVDEYGGIAGLVTLEDVLEEIVGDIRDEHDLEEALVLKQSDGSWLVSGSAHVEELRAVLGLEVEEGREFDTVGGLVVSRLGRVPAEGESLAIGRLQVEVVKADPRRVYRVRVRHADSTPEPAA